LYVIEMKLVFDCSIYNMTDLRKFKDDPLLREAELSKNR
jgi:hypothetical protein